MNHVDPLPIRKALVLVALGLAFAAAAVVAQGEERDGAADWILVDYSEILDGRQPTHSGESVHVVLGRLEGRPLPQPGERPADRMDHGLLDPLVEPYAFVLSDATDALEPVHDPPYVEIGSLWRPGEVQPAWVELLRARRYVVESDGQGSLRVFLPWQGAAESGGPGTGDSRVAARAAWNAAWPVLRHVFAAERRRLASNGDARAIEVEARAYGHLRERSTFVLGVQAEKITVEDTRADGRRVPLDLGELQRFLDGNLRLEGGRIEADGSLKLLGSSSARPPAMLGRPLDTADFAVAYRAVFHGGLAEPYMSLDRGYSPQRSIVSYGGRLRDTSLGLVSLLCDIRFKTFSLGLDIVEGRDLRETVRAALPEFRTHLEHLAAHPDSAGMAGQQTRLWFYPDKVDLTLSRQGDVLVLRRVRMSAASERVAETGERAATREDAPWTRDTVAAINRDYDALAEFFPEMSDLDQVVRLLSLFTWLRQLEGEGARLPELDSLLALELPGLTTPRSFPQLLAFNALPPVGSGVGVEVYDRVPIAEALDRLDPLSGRPLPAARRFQRAASALDRSQAEQAALLAEFAGWNVATLGESELDLLTYRAERLLMHHRVLSTLDPAPRRGLAERLRAGEQLRIFSVGVGGLDLGMRQVLDRAQGRRLGIAGADGAAEPSSDAASARESVEPREAWRADPTALPALSVPDHGLGREAKPGATRRFGNHSIEVGVTGAGAIPAAGQEPTRWIRTVQAADAPEVRSRRVFLDGGGRATSFERVEGGRALRYRFEDEGSGLVVRREPDVRTGSPGSPADNTPLPSGLVLFRVSGDTDGGSQTPSVGIRLDFSLEGSRRSIEADFPRPLLQRLVLGKGADMEQGQPLPGFSPLPVSLGVVRGLMVLPGAERWLPPWEAPPSILAGEEDPIRLARALGAWWNPDHVAIVGVDLQRSPGRWESAPAVGDDAVLLLPEGAFPAGWSKVADRLREAWVPGRILDRWSGDVAASLVIVVSAEPPGIFAERLRDLARNPAMKGRALAAWCLAGPVRADLPASLLAEGNVVAFGLAEDTVVGRREAASKIAAVRRALASGEGPVRPDSLSDPFLWYY